MSHISCRQSQQTWRSIQKKNEVFAANQDDIRYTIDNQRASISGVDKNEEGSNLTKFQELYRLASKVISVLNEVYDKLINETGV